MVKKTPQERFQSVSAPAGRTYRRQSGDHGMGDGDLCPVEGHGKMYVLSSSGKQWCAHQLHDMGQPRDASGNDWVNPRQKQETNNG